MSGMNEVIAGIYGTHNLEKVATADGLPISTLSDLALAIITEQAPEGSDLTKLASEHESVLDELEHYDLAGRSTAQSYFSDLEKRAFEGDSADLEEFFADVAAQEPVSELSQLKQAALAELQRRSNL